MALIAHWPLDGRLDDISGNGYHLTENKKLCYFEMDSRGIVLCGSGTSDSLDALRLSTNKVNFLEFSLSFWLKPKVTDGVVGNYSEPLFGNKYGEPSLNGSDTRNRTLNLYRYNTQTSIHSSTQRNPYGSGHVSTTNNLEFKDNTWYYITISDDGFNRYIYRNGELIDKIAVSGSRFEVLRNDDPISIMIKESRVSNYKLYNHVLTKEEIIKDMNEPILELDFKGSIPPTINWLDNVNKILTFGVIEKVSPNVIRANKNTSYSQSPNFKVPYKKFTMSFKVKVLSGILKKIGGHGIWNGKDQIPSSMTEICVDNVIYKNLLWSDSVTVPTPKNIGEIIECRISFNLPSIPTWESSQGLYIQPNRSLSDHIEYEIYDLQIEEGLEATPFCTWSRDELYIPDKSNFKNNLVIENIDTRELPIVYKDKQTDIGSSSGLLFNDNSCIELIPIKGITTFTYQIVFKPTSNFSGYNKYILNIRRIGDNSEDNNRFSIYFIEKKLNLLINGHGVEVPYSPQFSINSSYLLTLTVENGSKLNMYINGELFLTREVSTLDWTISREYPWTIGSVNDNASKCGFIISDLKIIPTVLTAEDIKKEYTRLKNRVLTFESAFENIPTLNTKVPKLWESNPNTIGVKCFSENPSIPKDQPIPIGWGGEFKQPSNSILSYGIINNTIIHATEEVMNIDSNLNPTRLMILTLEDNQNNEDLKLTVIDRFKN